MTDDKTTPIIFEPGDLFGKYEKQVYPWLQDRAGYVFLNPFINTVEKLNGLMAFRNLVGLKAEFFLEEGKDPNHAFLGVEALNCLKAYLKSQAHAQGDKEPLSTSEKFEVLGMEVHPWIHNDGNFVKVVYEDPRKGIEIKND